MSDPSIVALGGGHGLAASLSALRRLTERLTAVVTVADDGGSSGRLRKEFGVLPPGDLRMALAALCDDDGWGTTWANVLQHRFTSDGPLDGHATGNLLIVALWDLLGDQVKGLDLVGSLLGAHGRVLPMALDPIELTARVRGLADAGPEGLSTVRGQVEVATTAGIVESVALVPEDPRACPEAIDAICDADWVVLGPGSWYSSVIPHLLVPDLRRALTETDARVLVTLNLGRQQGETEHLSPADHLRVLTAHAPDLQIDAVLADERVATGAEGDDLAAQAESMGARLLCAAVAEGVGVDRHDPVKLGHAYAGLVAPN